MITIDETKLRDILQANMFDGNDDGIVTMKVKTLLDEIVEIITEHNYE